MSASLAQAKARLEIPERNGVYNDPDSAPAAFRANLPEIAARSFAVWQGAVNSAVNRQAYDGQNVVAWGRTSGFGPSGDLNQRRH